MTVQVTDGDKTSAPGSKLLSVIEAQARILAVLRLMPVEVVPLPQAYGRVCAADIKARLDNPPTPVSAMDGYACRSADVKSLPSRLRKVGVSRAGEHFPGGLTAGCCVRIFTGATVPDGADIIALQEDATETGDAVEIREVPRIGQHIRRAGLNFVTGQVCVEVGRVLTARDIGLLASSGNARIAVRRKPRVTLLSTGDELVKPGVDPGSDQIVASNGVALAAAVEGWGGIPIDLGIAPDQTDAIAAAIDQARESDLLVTTGGASVGDHDLVQASLAQRGFSSSFWRIAMRPGKPLMFGRLDALPVLTMPGNPVSALVCALLFLRPALRAMFGMTPAVPPFDKAVLGAAMPENDKREDYVRGTLEHRGGEMVVRPFPTQDSSMLLALARADVLIQRPSFAPPAKEGEDVHIIRLEPPLACL